MHSVPGINVNVVYVYIVLYMLIMYIQRYISVVVTQEQITFYASASDHVLSYHIVSYQTFIVCPLLREPRP